MSVTCADLFAAAQTLFQAGQPLDSIDPSTIASLSGFTSGNFSVVILSNSNPCFLDLSSVSDLSDRPFRILATGTVSVASSLSSINVVTFRGSAGTYPGGTNVISNSNNTNANSYGFTSYVDCVWSASSNTLSYGLSSVSVMGGHGSSTTGVSLYSSISQSDLKFEVACEIGSPSVGDALTLTSLSAYYI